MLSSGIAGEIADRHVSFLKMSQRKLNIAVIDLHSEGEMQLASIGGGWGNASFDCQFVTPQKPKTNTRQEKL